MAGPLSGVTVVELAGLGPAPFAGMILADMGAEVVRIDRIPAAGSSGFEAMKREVSPIDRGRRSLAVDLKDPRGLGIVLDVVAKADALIEGFRPGVTEKLGLGPAECLARNGRLVYGRMTGWGQTGPLAQAAGHDINYIALTGALHAMGHKDRPPPPPLNLIGDYGGGGMLLALGVIAALYDAGRTGRGQVVDAAMTDGSALLMTLIYGWLRSGHWRDERESNLLDGAAPFYGTYECADGKYVAIGAIETNFYSLLLERLGIEDALFADQWATAAWPERKARLAALFRTRSRAEWCRLLEGTDACFAPVLDLAEAPSHPHNAARGTFVAAGGTIQPAPAPRFSRTPSELPAPGPRLGRHSVGILEGLGRSSAEIADLLVAGVIHQASD